MQDKYISLSMYMYKICILYTHAHTLPTHTHSGTINKEENNDQIETHQNVNKDDH